MKHKPDRLDVMETNGGYRVIAWIDGVVYVHGFLCKQKSQAIALQAKIKSAGEISADKWSKQESVMLSLIEKVLGPINITHWERNAKPTGHRDSAE